MGIFEVSETLKKTYDKLLQDKKLLPLDQLNRGYELFSQKYNPTKLKSLDGEELIETIFYIGNRDSLTYWLEFKNDDEFKTNSRSYGSIAGGSSFKYIMFKRNSDGKWVTGNPQNPTILSIEEAVELGRELRDSLVSGAELIANLSEEAGIEDYIKLQEQLDSMLVKNMHSLGWVHKYYHMLFPNKIDAFHNTKWQKHVLICCSIKPEQEDKSYIMAGQIMSIVKETESPSSHIMNTMVSEFGEPVNYFRIGTGENAKNWHDMRTNSYVGIGWSELGDLNIYSDSKTLRKDVTEDLKKHNDYNNSTASRKAGEIVRFYNQILSGDIVVAVQGEKVLGIGQISGNYEYVADRSYPHCKNVEWIRIFKQPIQLPKASAGRLTSCYPYKDIDNIMELERLMKEDNSEDKPEVSLKPLTGVVANIESILKRKKQVILYGPPGTGKTYHAEKSCYELAARSLYNKSFSVLSSEERKSLQGDGRTHGLVRICCFHPSYGYEDFIEGIKPRVTHNQVVFEPRDGIFKTICSDAMKEPTKNFYLIIDEINRGDISRIFGELIMLIESGKREKEVILPLTNTTFSVPENVYVVGTMNTADRSISLLDVALRRRFGFIELMPDYTLLANVAYDQLPLAGWLKELNTRILEHIGKDARNLQIGHSYFLEKEKVVTDKEKFKKIVKEDIVPLIEEYCYGDYDLITKILGESLVDVKAQSIRTDLFASSDISELIAALLSPSPTLREAAPIAEEEAVDEDYDNDEAQNNGEDV